MSIENLNIDVDVVDNKSTIPDWLSSLSISETHDSKILPYSFYSTVFYEENYDTHNALVLQVDSKSIFNHSCYFSLFSPNQKLSCDFLDNALNHLIETLDFSIFSEGTSSVSKLYGYTIEISTELLNMHSKNYLAATLIFKECGKDNTDVKIERFIIGVYDNPIEWTNKLKDVLVILSKIITNAKKIKKFFIEYITE